VRVEHKHVFSNDSNHPLSTKKKNPKFSTDEIFQEITTGIILKIKKWKILAQNKTYLAKNIYFATKKEPSIENRNP